AGYVKETSVADMLKDMKSKIKDKFGGTLSDDGGKAWDTDNIFLAYSRLDDANTLLRGKLKSMINGAIFDLKDYVATKKNCPQGGCTYGGWTDGTHITFSTTGSKAITGINFFHEFGHLLNSLPGRDNIFSNQLDALDHPSFISNGYVN